MMRDAARVREVLGTPGLKRLVAAMVKRVRHGRALEKAVLLTKPTAEERYAVEGLLGRISRGESIRVRLEDVEVKLREAGICDTLAEAVEAVVGPVANERVARDRRAAEWDAVKEAMIARTEAVAARRAWVARQFETGGLKRLMRGESKKCETVMAQVLGVLEALPAPVEPLATFAARMTGDSHALDAGSVLSGLCLSALAHEQGVVFKASAGCRRRLWEAGGVVVDELSSPVLTLNLRADESTTLGRMLRAAREAGEPCYLTVRQLRRATVETFAGMKTPVYACENPSVLATAAQRWGASCAPMVCTSGQPGSAAQLLLACLRRSGCQVYYHGDLDPAGVTIANLLIKRFEVKPWRMGTGDYLTGVNGSCRAFKGQAVAALWDGELQGEMKRLGVAVLEEGVMEILMKDLRVDKV